MFRDRCQCLVLSHQGQTIPQLAELFNVHRTTIYCWFDLWEEGGIEALHKKPGQGRRPKLSPANPQHVERAPALVENERQNLKSVVAQLSNELSIEMHPGTLERFLKTWLHFPPIPQMSQEKSGRESLRWRQNKFTAIRAVLFKRSSGFILRR